MGMVENGKLADSARVLNILWLLIMLLLLP